MSDVVILDECYPPPGMARHTLAGGCTHLWEAMAHGSLAPGQVPVPLQALVSPCAQALTREAANADGHSCGMGRGPDCQSARRLAGDPRQAPFG